MQERYPDIEIYLKDPSLESVIAWLARHYPNLTQTEKGESVLLHLTPSMDALFVPNAVKGRFASLWFKQNETPWLTDEACAREAFAELGCEVRCNVKPWAPEEGEDEGVGTWLRLASTGESNVNWRA